MTRLASLVPGSSQLNSQRRPRVAVSFRRFGPYHYVRLNAAAKVAGIYGLEATAVDPIYAWERAKDDEQFEHFTLFPEKCITEVGSALVARRVSEALTRIAPQVFALSGWGDRVGLAALEWCARDGVPAIVMSESTIQDEPREWWKESFKRRVVRLCSAALVGGRLHADYMVQLGMPRERVFFGYDAVDNSYFAEGVAEIRGQRSEVGGQGSEGNAEMLKAGGEGTEDGRRKTEGGSQRSEVRRKYGLPEKYFLGMRPVH